MDSIRKKVPKIDQFLSGEVMPTFNQLSTIAASINVPTGVLVLDEPIDTDSTKLQFRTINSDNIDEMSPELRDTILEMQEKQNFLKDEIEDECPFVGIFDYDDDFEKVLKTVTNYLGEYITSDRFKNYRKLIGKLGVFIFVNGKIKDNSHRKLNLKEFRGFVLADKKAPIIFVNQQDTYHGRLFTLIHEFIHLFYGDNNLLDNSNSFSRNKKEAVINKVTAEILVPQKLLSERFDVNKGIYENLEFLANKFEVSKFVILRRLLDLNYISKKDYISINKKLEKRILEQLEVSKMSRAV